MDRPLGSPAGEQLIDSLCSLYDKHGYSRYKMSKFEEYDLYSRNKDFLISDSVITFTDTNGKLMALKPDVTLSIVRSSRPAPGAVEKVYYNENVYRVAKGSRTFRELAQVGLECLGDVDDYCLCEVLCLAAESLACVGRKSRLEVSHLGILTEVMQGAGLPEEDHAAALRLIGEKNMHELGALCTRRGVSEADGEALRQTALLRGDPRTVSDRLERIAGRFVRSETFARFSSLASTADAFAKGAVEIDFSVVDDPKYYNGFVFKGFVEGVPNRVLSGGQYDRLMRRMNREAGAVGFAVYVDLLEPLFLSPSAYDLDAVLLYGSQTPAADVCAAVEDLTEKGYCVSALRQVPEGKTYRRLFRLENGEVTVLEDKDDA